MNVGKGKESRLTTWFLLLVSRAKAVALLVERHWEGGDSRRWRGGGNFVGVFHRSRMAEIEFVSRYDLASSRIAHRAYQIWEGDHAVRSHRMNDKSALGSRNIPSLFHRPGKTSGTVVRVEPLVIRSRWNTAILMCSHSMARTAQYLYLTAYRKACFAWRKLVYLLQSLFKSEPSSATSSLCPLQCISELQFGNLITTNSSIISN